jgi:general secretion pathway protein H
MRGFTLLELLVVLVVVGIMLGVVAVNALQTNHQKLQTDAQRLALLFQLARDEAIVRNRPTAFEASENSYHFLVRNENRWDVINDLDLLRERSFMFQPTILSLSNGTRTDGGALRILFGREPVDRPFVLELVAGEERASIRSDGIGHFVAE